jgi:hypothetical protein
MGEDIEPTAETAEAVQPPTHERILWIMAILGIGGGIGGVLFASLGFGFGIVVGTALAFVNYYWLKSSLRKIFDAAGSGERPRGLIGTYIIRYIALAAVVAVIYVSGILPIVAVIFGLAAFGFAVLIEGLIRLFSTFFREKEI